MNPTPLRQPRLTIVSVCRNDAWSLTKTCRSVFRQSFQDYEYLVVDGASTDGTAGLIEFWTAQGLITRAISEPDTGVYNAMNKAVAFAQGEFVCFLNAGDVFADDDVLARVHDRLSRDAVDGLLGWGQLNGQVWASWIEDAAFKLASLGFCHQALFVRRLLLQAHPFDERPFKTDSDTLQLGRLYAAGARIPIVPEVLAIRGAEPGISADLERTHRSIRGTLVEEYPELDEATADQIVNFRRRCADPAAILTLLSRTTGALRRHVACMVMDTLFMRQAASLEAGEAEQLATVASKVLSDELPHRSFRPLERLLLAQRMRNDLMLGMQQTADRLKVEVDLMNQQEARRLDLLRTASQRGHRQRHGYVVSMTSFPARLSTLHLVVQSLISQTCPPDAIHIWLGQDEVPARHWLPRALLALEDRGLQVHFVRRTFHQYDKFMHNSDLNREQPFVIVDDDVIYPPESMERLLESHRAFPEAVIANRCHRMLVAPDGGFGAYQAWPREVMFDRPRQLAFPTGAGGVLYPHGFLSDPRVLDVRSALACAPYADDIWLKACALARGIRSVGTPLSQGAKWYLRYTPTMRSGALHATNVDLGLNDRQLARAAQWLDRVRPQWRAELLSEAAN